MWRVMNKCRREIKEREILFLSSRTCQLINSENQNSNQSEILSGMSE